jgi:hypothetical protein
MIDAQTKRRLEVSRSGKAGPYIMVPLDQVEAVRGLLDTGGFRYWVDEAAISLDGNPYITVVNFSRETNPDAVQTLLDSAS